MYQYFLDTAVAQDLSVSGFFAAGGIQLDREPAENNGESLAEYLLQTFGQRVVKIDIGSYTGAIVWADPDLKGIRTHNLTWSDGKYNYTLTAVASPEHVVTLARGLACQ